MKAKTITSIIFSLVVGIVMTSVGLRYISFQMASFSEEAGILIQGFPYPIIKSGPFYAGYVGTLAREGGKEYLLNATGAFLNPQICFPGLLANLVFYSSLGGMFVLIFNNRNSLVQSAIQSASRKLNENGILLGSAKIFVIVTVCSFTFLLTFFSFVGLLAAILGIDVVL